MATFMDNWRKQMGVKPVQNTPDNTNTTSQAPVKYNPNAFQDFMRQVRPKVVKANKYFAKQERLIGDRNQFYSSYNSQTSEPKYNFSDAMRLSEYGYTGLYGRSDTKKTLGLYGDEWQQAYALDRLRKNKEMLAFSVMNNTDPGTLKDLAAATPLIPGKSNYNNLLTLSSKFGEKYGVEGEKYASRYGALPKVGSKYGILFNTNNQKIRRDDVNVTYQNDLVRQAVGVAKDLNKIGVDVNSDVLKAQALEYAGLKDYRIDSTRAKYSPEKTKELEQKLSQVPSIVESVAKALGGEEQSAYSRVATSTIGGMLGGLALGPTAGMLGSVFGADAEGSKKVAKTLDYMNGLADDDLLKARKTYWTGKENVPWSQYGLVGLTGNALRGIGRMGLGLPAGLALANDEAYLAGKETAKWATSGGDYDWGNKIDFKLGDAIWQDYANRYYDPFATRADGTKQSWWQGLDDSANWDAMGEKINSDPTAYALDILDVAPIVGWGAKAGAVASVAARTGRVFGKVGLTAADEAALRLAKTRARGGVYSEYDVPEYVKVAPGWMDFAALKNLEDVASLETKINQAPSARTFRRTMRGAINGDALNQAELNRWQAMGYEFNGADKSFSIRASALFEPRTKVLAKPESVLEASDRAIIRLPASPIMRGMKEAFFWVGRGVDKAAISTSEKPGVVGRVGTKFLDMPLFSYRYNYTKAIKNEAVYEWGDVATELSRAKTLLEIDNEADLTPTMSRAVEAQLVGGAGEVPLNFPAIQRQQLQDKIATLRKEFADKNTGEVVPQARKDLANLELELSKLLDDEIVDIQKAAASFDEAFNEDLSNLRQRLSDATFNADDPILDKAEALYRRLDRQDQAVRSRIVHEDTNPTSIAHLKLLYREAMDGLRLSATHLFGEDGKTGRVGRYASRVLRVNTNLLLTGMAKKGDRQALINLAQRADEDGTVFDTITDPALRKQREDEMVQAVTALDRAGMFVDGMGSFGVPGRPVLIRAADNVGDDFVAFHIPTLRHEMYNGKVKNGKIIDTNETFVLPKVFFAARNKGKGAPVVESAKVGKELLYQGALNAMSNVYPKARFYSEKINDTGQRGVRMNEQMIANEGRVAESGMRQHALSRLIQSQVHYMKNRVERDLRSLAESQAVLVPAKLVNGKTPKESGYHVLHNIRPFDSAAEALDFARLRGVSSEVEKALMAYADGSLTPMQTTLDLDTGLGIIIKENGEPQFIVRGGTHDWVSEANQESLAEHSTTKAWIAREFSDPSEIPDNGFVFAVPDQAFKDLAEMTIQSDNLSQRLLSSAGVRGWGNLFKFFVLNANPAFIANNVIGGLAMMLMYNPHVAPRLMSTVIQKIARDSIRRGINNDAFTLQLTHFKNDSEAVARSIAYENEHNIYKQDAGLVGATKPEPFFKKYVWHGGYTVVSTWEEMMRRNVAMEFLRNDAGFQSFMRGPEVRKYIEDGVDWHGNVRQGDEAITPFEAATDLLLDRGSPYFNANLKHRMRYTTNTVSGNYHNFSAAEQLMRNVVMPFYAWQRHSATFSYRMLVDKPITTNVLYNLGQQGYLQNAEQGVPDWMMGSIPPPQAIKDMFGIEDTDFRIDGNALTPFGTTGEMGMAAFSLLTGAESNSSVWDFTNPYLNQMIKDTLHVNPQTGAIDWKALQEDSTSTSGVLDMGKNMFSNIYKATYPYKLGELAKYQEYEQDSLRNKYAEIDNAPEILKNYDPMDPDGTWKLSIPKMRTTEALDPTQRVLSALGVRSYRLNPSTLPMSSRQDAVGAMVLQVLNEDGKKSKAEKAVTAATEWQRRYDYVTQVWLPAAEAQGMDPNQIQLVLSKIRDERPKTGIAKQLTGG
jgi:hypothetical protein